MAAYLGTRKGLAMVVSLQTMLLAYDLYFYGGSGELPLAIELGQIALFVLFVISSVLRCRSLNWSGWRVLAFPVPIAGIVLLLLLLFTPERRGMV